MAGGGVDGPQRPDGARFRELMAELHQEHDRLLRWVASVSEQKASCNELVLECPSPRAPARPEDLLRISAQAGSEATCQSGGAPKLAFEDPHRPSHSFEGEDDCFGRSAMKKDSCGSTRSNDSLDGSPSGEKSRSSMEALRKMKASMTTAFDVKAGDPFFKDSEANRPLLERLFGHPVVELTFSLLIFTNTLVIASEAQYMGMQSGHESSVGMGSEAWRGAETPAVEVWPNAKPWFQVLDVLFGVIFTAELALKFVAFGVGALKDVWTYLDGAIIGFWLIEQAAKNILPADPKIMRVARLARLLRFLRVVKTIQAFDSLYLMVQAIRSSMAALFWSCILLLLTEMMLALVLNFLLEGFWSDEQIEEERRMLVYSYFGTFTRALQTMTEMLLGNWYSITRLLTENVSEWYMVFGLSHQLVIGFAVIEVITGVFLHQTFTVASMDDSIMMNEMKVAMQEQTKKINRFFEAADEDGSGTLDEGEFNEVIAKESVQDWLDAMGLPVHTFPNAFAMFDPYGTGEIDAEKMAAGASRMKGQATAFELAIVRNLVEDISRALKRDAGANNESQQFGG